MQMREKIARALARDALEHNGHTYIGDQLEFYAGQTWKNYTRQVDAVLAAMRTPTQAMKDAGCGFVGCWQAMIDAAGAV